MRKLMKYLKQMLKKNHEEDEVFFSVLHLPAIFSRILRLNTPDMHMWMTGIYLGIQGPEERE